MKSRKFILLIVCVSCCSFLSTDTTITPTELKNLVGCWKGSITYLDYTTNKPFSMPANITVNDFGKSNIITASLVYPDEPAANTLDTIFISEDGRSLNSETITSKIKFNKDSLQVVTETAGIDGNDNQPAVIRHIYTISSHVYSIRKEVQFTGQTNWIMRHEFKFMRVKPCR